MATPCAAADTAQMEATRMDKFFIFFFSSREECVRSIWGEVSTNSLQVPLAPQVIYVCSSWPTFFFR